MVQKSDKKTRSFLLFTTIAILVIMLSLFVVIYQNGAENKITRVENDSQTKVVQQNQSPKSTAYPVRLIIGPLGGLEGIDKGDAAGKSSLKIVLNSNVKFISKMFASNVSSYNITELDMTNAYSLFGKIESNAFLNMRTLKVVILPSKVTVEAGAFTGISNLQVYLPTPFTSFSDVKFEGSSQLGSNPLIISQNSSDHTNYYNSAVTNGLLPYRGYMTYEVSVTYQTTAGKFSNGSTTITERRIHNKNLKFQKDPASKIYTQQGSVNYPSGVREGYTNNPTFLHNGAAVDENKLLTGDIVLTAKWHVSQAEVTDSNYNLQYNSAAHTISVQVKIISGITYTYKWYKQGSQTVLGTGSTIKLTNVNESGTYECWVYANADGSTGAGTKATITVNIAPIKIKGLTLVDDLVYNGQMQSAKFTGDATKCDIQSESKKDAGNNYKATVKLKDPNYAFESGAMTDFTWKIAPKAITVTIDNKSSIFGEKIAGLTSQTPSGVIGTDNLGITLTRANQDKITVGEYVIDGSASNGNYKVTFIKGKYTISKRLITLSWNSLPLVYDGTAKTPSVTVGNVVPNYGCNANIALTPGKNNVDAGTFTFTANSLTDSINYELPSNKESIAYTITPKVISIVWCNNDFTYNGKDQQSEVKATYVDVKGDTIRLTTVGKTFKDYSSGGVEFSVQFANGEKNYKLPSESESKRAYHIKKRAVSVQANPSSMVYGNNPKEMTFSWKESSALKFIAEDKVELKLKTNAENTSPVGSYDITFEEVDYNNYTITYAKGVLSITKRSVVIQIKNAESVYGESLSGMDYTVFEGTIVNGDTLNLKFEKANGANVGNYTITGTYNNSNYTVTFKNGTYTIKARVITITWKYMDSDIYDKKEKNVIVEAGNLINSDICNIKTRVSSGSNIDVGYFTLMAYELDNPNYTLPTAGLTSGQYEIKPYELTSVTWDKKIDLVYSGIEKKPTATANGLFSGDTTFVNVEFNDGDNINVGKFTFKTVSLTNKNYTLKTTYVSDDYYITQRVVVLNWNNILVENLIYDKNQKVPTATVKNKVDKDNCSVEVKLSANGDNINVGKFTFYATSVSNPNYKLPDNMQDLTSIEYEITPRALTLTWDDIPNLIYNKQAKTTNAKITGGLITGDSCNISVALTKGDDNVNVTAKGSFTFTAVITDIKTNYKLDYPQSPLFKITPKVIGLRWDVFDAKDLVYNGDPKSPSAYALQLEVGDNCIIDVSVGTGNNKYVGTFTFKADGTTNINYKLPSEVSSPTYEITPKVIKDTDLKWEDTLKDAIYNGLAKSASVEIVSGLVSGDTCKVNVKATEGENNINVGNFTLSITGLENKNYIYQGNVKSPSYKIEPKEILVEWEKADLIYNGKAQLPTTAKAATGSLVGTDSCNIYVGHNSGDNINVGKFTAKATGVSNPNYTLSSSVTTGEYEIKPYTIKVVWNKIDNLVYNGEKKIATARAEQVFNNESCGIEVELIANGDNINVGTFKFKAIATLNPNYKLPIDDVISGDYEITPKEISLKWNLTDKLVYDGNEKFATATAENTINGEECEVVVKVNSGSNNIRAGRVTFRADSVKNKNYKLPTYVLSGEYEILPKVINTLIWEDTLKDAIYNGRDKIVKATAGVGELIGNDECEILATVTVGYDNRNVGVFTFTATGVGNTDYKVASNLQSKQYTIQPKSITVTWDAPADLIYSGTAKVPTATAGGLITGDNCRVVVALASGNNINVGKFTYATIRVDNPNYTLPVNVVSDEYEITPKQIAIDWCLNDFTYNGKDQKNKVKASYKDVFNSVVELVVTGTEFRNYSENGVVFNVQFANQDINYKLPANVSKTFNMKKLKVFVQADNVQMNYGGKVPTLTWSYAPGSAQFVAEDNITLTLSTQANKNSELGKYDITINPITNENYEIAYTYGEINIVRLTLRPVIITLSIILALELIYIVLSFLKKKRAKGKFNTSVFSFMMLIYPVSEVVSVIILSILVVVAAIYIILDLLKNRQQAVEGVIIEDDEDNNRGYAKNLYIGGVQTLSLNNPYENHVPLRIIHEDYIACADYDTSFSQTDESAGDDMLASCITEEDLYISSTKFSISKKILAEEMVRVFGKKIEVAERGEIEGFFRRPDTYFAYKGKTKYGKKLRECFLFSYDIKEGAIKLIFKFNNEAKIAYKDKYPSLSRSKFPKGRGWYMVNVDENFKSLKEVIDLIEVSMKLI